MLWDWSYCDDVSMSYHSSLSIEIIIIQEQLLNFMYVGCNLFTMWRHKCVILAITKAGVVSCWTGIVLQMLQLDYCYYCLDVMSTVQTLVSISSVLYLH